MQLNFSPNLLPFNTSERAGVVGGTVSPVLSALDRSGVVYKQGKSKNLPAVNAPLGDLPGMSPTTSADDPATHSAKLEHQARQLISQTFFGTMLKQMRDSPFKSDLFEGGRGGQAFSGLYDQKLVEQMSRGAGKKLVDAVVRKFDAKNAYAKQGKASPFNAKLKTQDGKAAENSSALNTNPNQLTEIERSNRAVSPTNATKEATRAASAI